MLAAGIIAGPVTDRIPFQTVAAVRARPTSTKVDHTRIRGIVTSFSGWKNSFFLQDRGGAISIDRAEDTPVEVGDEVEVTGHARAGLFANVFMSERIQVLRHASLPPAQVVTYRALQTGAYDSRLVEISATVHAVRLTEVWGRKMLLLDLQTGDSALTAYLPDPSSGAFHFLVDSEIRVAGVCGTIFNDRKQLIGLRLFVPGIDHIRVLAKGKDPMTIPLSRLDSLLTFQGPSLDHRVRVRGSVTYQAPDGDLFLQDGRSAIRISGLSSGVWRPGTQAEAWGFIASRGYLPDLKNASLRVIGEGKPPAPIHIQPLNVITLDNGFEQAPYDGLLVQMEGKIVDKIPNTGSTIWALEAGGVRFEVEIANAPRGWALGFESGTQVRVTGICIAETDPSGIAKSFHLLLRSPSDLVAISRPYWNQSLLLLVVTYAFILIAGLLIYFVLRRNCPDVFSHEEETNSPVEAGCRRIAELLASSAILVGLTIFLTDPSQAPALMAAGVAVLLGRHSKARVFKAIRLVCISLVILRGSAAVVEGWAGWEWLRFSQMPLSTAVSLLLLGFSSLAVSLKRLLGVGQMLAISVAFTALVKLVGAAYGAGAGSGLAVHLTMSVPSALALFSLSAATLLSAPECGLMKTICSPRLGGIMLRRLIPAAMAIPILVGGIRLQLQVLGFFDTRFGLTLFALSNALCFCFLLWTSAAILNRSDRLKAKTEEALREREQKLELIFETGSMGDWLWNIEPDSLAAHPSVWNLYGEPDKRGSESAEWFQSRQHPDDQAWLRHEVEKAQACKLPLDCEFRVIWPDLSIHWLYCRAVPIFDEAGKLVQMSGINLDITDRKVAESKMKKGEALFRKLQDAMPQIVWTADQQGGITHYNQRWFEYTGLSAGQSWAEVLQKDDVEPITRKWSRSIELGVPYENEVLLLRASDQTYRWHLVRGVPIYNEHGQVEQWFGTNTDVDDFKRANQQLGTLNETLERRVEERSRALAKAERKFRLMVESVKDYAIYMLDADGKVESWNHGAERLKGYRAKEIIGRHFSVFYTADDIAEGEPERNLVMAAAEGRVVREAQRVRKDGTRFWASVLISAVYDADGRLCGFSKVIRDVTERRRSEQLLIAAQKRAEEANVAKSSFLAAMSHEIRTPMNAILGMADLLWDTVLDRTQREYVGRFRRAGANLLTLINDILDLSKIESGRFDLEAVDFDLLELVDRAIEIASPGAALKGISLEIQMAPETPTLLVGDPVRLQQVLNNLIGNAVKFTPSGRVLLQIGSHLDGAKGHLEFAVSDTGIGIPQDKLGAIFEDFTQAESSTTRRFGGTGLGLGICRRLVQKMNGTLSVESVPDVGSTFRFDAGFTIGALRAELAPKELSDLAGKTVLIVDDNSTNRMIIGEMCSAWGMRTRTTASAAEAIALVTEARQAKEDFGLILLDRVLPDTNGFETLREIKCIDPKIPVIIASSDNQLGDLTEAKALGAAAYLMKPIRRSELRTCIFEALSTAVAGSQQSPTGNETEKDSVPLKILLVEDSEDNRFLVQAYLPGKDFHLSFAEDGQKGVEAFANGNFDLILMDVQMPIMDGLTATRRIRTLERERALSPTAIIALTANALLEDSQRSLEAGCNGHLAKPISKDKLIAAIQGHRSRATAADVPGEPFAETAEKYAFRIPPGFETISRKYIRKHLEAMSHIRLSLASGSLDELRTIGHQMKGTGSSYGFDDLTALGAAIEDAAEASDLQKLETHISSMERYVTLAVESLG